MFIFSMVFAYAGLIAMYLVIADIFSKELEYTKKEAMWWPFLLTKVGVKGLFKVLFTGWRK